MKSTGALNLFKAGIKAELKKITWGVWFKELSLNIF
jgi:hypothetical protein